MSDTGEDYRTIGDDWSSFVDALRGIQEAGASVAGEVGSFLRRGYEGADAFGDRANEIIRMLGGGAWDHMLQDSIFEQPDQLRSRLESEGFDQDYVDEAVEAVQSRRHYIGIEDWDSSPNVSDWSFGRGRASREREPDYRSIAADTVRESQHPAIGEHTHQPSGERPWREEVDRPGVWDDMAEEELAEMLLDPRNGSPADIARLQHQLEMAGLLTEGYTEGVWLEDSYNAYERLMTYAMQEDVEMEEALEDILLARQWATTQDFDADEVVRDLVQDIGAQMPSYQRQRFIAPAHIARDPDVVALDVRDLFRDSLGRDPHDHEVQRYTDLLLSADREAFDADVQAQQMMHEAQEDWRQEQHDVEMAGMQERMADQIYDQASEFRDEHYEEQRGIDRAIDTLDTSGTGGSPSGSRGYAGHPALGQVGDEGEGALPGAGAGAGETRSIRDIINEELGAMGGGSDVADPGDGGSVGTVTHPGDPMDRFRLAFEDEMANEIDLVRRRQAAGEDQDRATSFFQQMGLR